jgi:hypothetical protein
MRLLAATIGALLLSVSQPALAQERHGGLPQGEWQQSENQRCEPQQMDLDLPQPVTEQAALQPPGLPEPPMMQAALQPLGLPEPQMMQAELQPPELPEPQMMQAELQPLGLPEPQVMQAQLQPLGLPEPQMAQAQLPPLGLPEPQMTQAQLPPLGLPEPQMTQAQLPPLGLPEPQMTQAQLPPLGLPEPQMTQAQLPPLGLPEPQMAQAQLPPLGLPEPQMTQAQLPPLGLPEPQMTQAQLPPLGLPEPQMDQAELQPPGLPEPDMLASLATGALPPDAKWTVFVEPSLGTRMDLPSAVFSAADGAAYRGVGRQFKTADGRAALAIYSQRNDNRDTPASYLRKNFVFPRAAISYERVTRNFFAVSGTREGMIFYSRCNLSPTGATLHCFDMQFPAAEKAAWDAIVTRMSLSLRPLNRS